MIPPGALRATPHNRSGNRRDRRVPPCVRRCPNRQRTRFLAPPCPIPLNKRLIQSRLHSIAHWDSAARLKDVSSAGNARGHGKGTDNHRGSRDDVSIQPLYVSGVGPACRRGRLGSDSVPQQAEGSGRLRGRDSPPDVRPALLRTPGAFALQRGASVLHDAGPALRLARGRVQHAPRDGVPGAASRGTPLPGRDYCPSHKHLEETFESAEIPASAGETIDNELGSLAPA